MGTERTHDSWRSAMSSCPNVASNTATFTDTSANANANRFSFETCESHWVSTRFAKDNVANVRWIVPDWNPLRNCAMSTDFFSTCDRVAAICWT